MTKVCDFPFLIYDQNLMIFPTLFPYPGLCSKSARVPQATNFCLWATRKTNSTHISFMLGNLDLIVWSLWAPSNLFVGHSLAIIL